MLRMVNISLSVALAMSETKINLPPSFLLGAASSAHQVEGNNIYNDWWHYEENGQLPASGKAADHYNRYQEDFELAKKLGLNAMRISIEWGRIEPKEGQWDYATVEHYRQVLQSLRKLDMKCVITLHHFTLPLWLSSVGGFENKKSIEAFTKFARFVAEQLGEQTDYIATINEPNVYVYMSYMKKLWPPFKSTLWISKKVFSNLIAAHLSAYTAIKNIRPRLSVGLVNNNSYYEPVRSGHWLETLGAKFARWLGNHYILDRTADKMDFIGLNYYFSHKVKFSWKRGYQLFPSSSERTDMNWPIFPEGLYHLLLDLKKYRKPIFITENGLADARDDKRYHFILKHLEWARKAIDQGVDLRGYFYWSLTDTYEWHDGYGPKFGLVSIDFKTLERKIRPSASIFKELQ